MHRTTLVAVLVLLFLTVASAQPEDPPEVRVVNLPKILPVTGNELRTSQELMAQLLVHAYGVLPAGLPLRGVQQCMVTGLGEMHAVETVKIPSGSFGCDLQAYTAACTDAAERTRCACAKTCKEFKLVGKVRACRGNTRPVIEPFDPQQHCTSTRDAGATISCGVTAWCNCDP